MALHSAQEMAYLRRTLPILNLRTADLGEDHRVVTVSAIDATIRLLQEHHAVCEAMVAKSEEWKKGDKWRQSESGMIDHMDKGSVMRFHEHVMRPAGPDEVSGCSARCAGTHHSDSAPLCTRRL